MERSAAMTQPTAESSQTRQPTRPAAMTSRQPESQPNCRILLYSEAEKDLRQAVRSFCRTLPAGRRARPDRERRTV